MMFKMILFLGLVSITFAQFPEQAIVQGLRLTNDIPTVHPEYKFEIEVYPTGTTNGWGNIVHLSATGNDCCNVGDRLPAIGFFKDLTKITLCSTANGNGNHCVPSPNNLPMNTWSKIIIEQKLDNASVMKYTVSIDGTIINDITNNSPQTFTNVAAWVGNTYHFAGAAKIRNFLLTTGGIEYTIHNNAIKATPIPPVTGQTELFAASGNDASYSSRWTGWYTPGSNRASGATIGKSKAYDSLKLKTLSFEVDDGTKIDVDLVGTQYEDMTLLEIVQSTGITASSRNNGQGLWNTGHIALPITNKVNPNNHKMGSTLRIVVGDGSNDGFDFCMFYFNDDNGKYDYHGYSAFGFGSETRYNPGYRGGICSIYGTANTAPIDCPNSAWVYNFEDESCVPKSSNYGLVCRDDGFDLEAHHDIYGGDFSVGSCNFAFGGATGLVTKTFLFADCTPNSYSDATGKNHNEFVAEPTTGMHATLQIYPSINIHCIHQAFTTMTFTLFFEYDSEVIDDLLEYESGNIQNIVSIYSSSSDYMVGSTVHFHIKSVERVDNFVLELVSCTVSSPGNPHSADLFNAAIHPFLDVAVNGVAYASSMNMDSNIWVGDLWNIDYKGFKFVQEQDEFHHKVSCSLKVKSQSGALGTPPTSSG